MAYEFNVLALFFNTWVFEKFHMAEVIPSDQKRLFWVSIYCINIISFRTRRPYSLYWPAYTRLPGMPFLISELFIALLNLLPSLYFRVLNLVGSTSGLQDFPILREIEVED